MIYPPAITVAADAPIGTTLWRVSALSFNTSCWVDATSPEPDYAALSRADLRLPGYGLAFVLTYDGTEGSDALKINTGVLVDGTFSGTQTSVSGVVGLSLVKTGETPSGGSVSTASITAFDITGMGESDTNTTTYNIYNLTAISFVTYTCDLDSSSRTISVPLGDVRIDKFSGVGSTSTDQSFSIGLSCTQPSGTYNVALTFNGTADSTGAPGVIALTPSANAATGVGIQLLMNGSPVDLGTALEAGSATAGATLSIPMTARYYQTAATITPGVANGIATFTVSYK